MWGLRGIIKKGFAKMDLKNGGLTGFVFRHERFWESWANKGVKIGFKLNWGAFQGQVRNRRAKYFPKFLGPILGEVLLSTF